MLDTELVLDTADSVLQGHCRFCAESNVLSLKPWMCMLLCVIPVLAPFSSLHASPPMSCLHTTTQPSMTTLKPMNHAERLGNNTMSHSRPTQHVQPAHAIDFVCGQHTTNIAYTISDAPVVTANSHHLRDSRSPTAHVNYHPSLQS